MEKKSAQARVLENVAIECDIAGELCEGRLSELFEAYYTEEWPNYTVSRDGRIWDDMMPLESVRMDDSKRFFLRWRRGCLLNYMWIDNDFKGRFFCNYSIKQYETTNRTNAKD